MKKLILILIAIMPLTGYTKGKPKKVKILNDITEEKINFTNELNLYQNTVYLNTSLIYSNNGFSIGASSTNINLYGDQAQNYENDSYFIISKSFEITDDYNFTIGSQNGYNLPNPYKLHSFEFIDNQFALDDYVDLDLDVHFGLYYANQELATVPQHNGFIAGFEYKFDEWSLQGDYYSGHNNLSGAVVNLFYKLNPMYSVYLGLNVPEAHSGNEYAGNIGLSIDLN